MRDSHVHLISTKQQHIKPAKNILDWLKKLASSPKPVTKKAPDQPNKDHRYLNLVKQIDNALISSSPECHFTRPNILEHLVKEENKLLSEQKRIALLQQKPTIPQPKRHSLTQRKPTTVPPLINEKVLDNQLPQSILAYSPIRASDLLADCKKGLEHLLLDTKSLDSFRHHQSITLGFTLYPIGCPDRPCLGPIMSTIDYFCYQAPKTSDSLFPRTDQSLGDTIRHWYRQCQNTCQHHIDEQTQFMPETPPTTTDPPESRHSESSFFSRSSHTRQCSKFHGCQQPLVDHVFSFTHGTGRIHVYTNTEPTTRSTIMTCISCNVCDASTPYIELSEQAASYSFSKYLELLFYSKKLASPEPFCEHSKLVPIRTFLYKNVSFKFMHENTTVYGLQLPRLQIGPHPLVSEKISITEPRISLNVLTQWKQHMMNDIDVFFKTVSSGKEADRKALVNRLMETNINELNDFKRYFTIQSETIYKQPVVAKDVHYFPGSSVPVREQEPTSIIAYTLSSNDYFQELLRDDNDDGSSGKTISVPSTEDKPLPPHIIDGYYSSIERKYVSPSTGATSETASFRSMITEVVKSSVEVRSERWIKRHDDIEERKVTERIVKPVQEESKIKKTTSPHIKHSKYPHT